jgi:phosphotriesterase-related protein
MIVRTVHGDIGPEDLGVTYAHEHLVIDGGPLVAHDPDFDLADVDRMAVELESARALGLRSAIDAMPIGAGRNVRKLAALASRTGIHVVASTGLHHGRWYGPGHWSETASVAEIADRFAAEVSDGLPEADDATPAGPRTEHRAGVVKVGGSQDRLSDRDRRVFAAAAETHRRTGVPILTHCENGTAALEQVLVLADLGVEPGRVALSHVDRVVDRGYHRELLSTGATAEYDGAFRWGDRPNGTVQLIGWMVEDGHADRIVLGLDAARRSYLPAFGGIPGLAYLLGDFRTAIDEAGLGDVVIRLLVDNPARVFAFEPVASLETVR